MNVKKFLKKQAKADLKALETENDRAFLQRLKSGIEANKMQFYIPPNAPLIIDEVQNSQGLAEARKKCRELAPLPFCFGFYFGDDTTKQTAPLPIDEQTLEK